MITIINYSLRGYQSEFVYMFVPIMFIYEFLRVLQHCQFAIFLTPFVVVITTLYTISLL